MEAFCDHIPRSKTHQRVREARHAALDRAHQPGYNVFLFALKAFCSETHVELLRSWYAAASEEKSGKSIDELSSAQTDAKLALAVATSAKAVYCKLPKTEEREEKTLIVLKTKKHIEKAKLGKART